MERFLFASRAARNPPIVERLARGQGVVPPDPGGQSAR